MSGRYRIHPDDTWHQMLDKGWIGADSPVTIERRDVLEVGGTVWRDGARRVKAPGKRTRVFIGEMAWAEAERLASDYDNEIRQAELDRYRRPATK